MQKLIVYIALTFPLHFFGSAIASDNCTEIEYESSYKEGRPIKNSIEQISAPGALLSGGKVSCKMSGNYQDALRTNKLLRIETGEYKNVKYRFYYSDGGGSVQGLASNTLDVLSDPPNSNWNIICKADGMDDSVWCSLSKGDLSVIVWKDGSPIVSVGRNHFPGTSYSLRVDGQNVFQAKEDAGFSKLENKNILEQLESGETVLTRYVEWPSESYIDTKTNLFGLSVAYELASLIRQKILEN